MNIPIFTTDEQKLFAYGCCMSSGDSEKNERRRQVRYPLRGSLPATLVLGDRELSFILVDVSTDGLGLVLSEETKDGDVLYLEFKDESIGRIELGICWCIKTQAWPDIYRAGLKVLQDVDLVKVFENFDSVYLEDMS